MGRVFVYDGREFPDPDPSMSNDEVRQQMANFFPELSNAETKTNQRGGDTIIEFKRRVGTKGSFRGIQRRLVGIRGRLVMASILLVFLVPTFPPGCWS